MLNQQRSFRTAARRSMYPESPPPPPPKVVSNDVEDGRVESSTDEECTTNLGARSMDDDTE